MDIRLALMCGIDIPIPELQLTIHQPKIQEIAYIGETDFFLGVQCLTVNKNSLIEDESLLSNTSNFQIFMMIMNKAETAEKKKAVVQLLSILFPNQKCNFTPRSLMIGTVAIDEEHFELFQAVLKEIFCFKSSQNDQATFNPGNKKAKEIAEKLMRGRQRVAELNGSANASIFSQYLSALTIGVQSMSLQNLMDLTMFQLYDLVERYQLYINWDIDIRSRLAGAKPEGKPENWMKNIH